jgi:hypothetical protein
MGDDPAAWRCRRRQGASDGPALPRGRRDPAHIQDDRIVTAWARAGVRRIATATQASKTGKQGERSFLLLSSPKRRPVLQEGPRSCLRAPARCRAVSGLGHEAVHGQMVTHGTASMRPATLLAHCGTTDPCGGEVSQRGNDGAAARHGIAGPSDPGKGRECPTPSLSPVRRAGLDHRTVPARITERFRLGSTGGSVEHLKTGCVNNHIGSPAGRDGRPGAACRPGSRPASTAP